MGKRDKKTKHNRGGGLLTPNRTRKIFERDIKSREKEIAKCEKVLGKLDNKLEVVTKKYNKDKEDLRNTMEKKESQLYDKYRKESGKIIQQLGDEESKCETVKVMLIKVKKEFQKDMQRFS